MFKIFQLSDAPPQLGTSFNVTFARVDVGSNTLPWNVYFEHLPQIILYPHHR